jgi:hypothetical protein
MNQTTLQGKRGVDVLRDPELNKSTAFTKIEKGALHVSYDPLATTEKKIEQAIRSTGTTIKTAATDTEGAHPDLPTSGENSPTTAER